MPRTNIEYPLVGKSFNIESVEQQVREKNKKTMKLLKHFTFLIAYAK